MQQIDIREAKLDLPALLDAAVKGADIIIMQDSQPLVRLSHVSANDQPLASGPSHGAVTTIAAPSISARQAQAAANQFLSDQIPDRFLGGSPALDPVANVWRVPFLLAYAVIGPVGQTGEILISAATGAVVSHTPLEEMKTTARALYEQHREVITSPLPYDLTGAEMEAMSLVGGFLNDRLPDRFCADKPRFDRDAFVWRAPILLSYPTLGPIGQVGEITVSVSADKILSFTPLEEMKAAAQTLIEQHRDQIEAPLP